MITRGCRWRTGGFLKSPRTVPSNLTLLISHAEDLISEFWEQHPEQRPKPKKQVTTKGGKGKHASLEISPSKSKSRSRYEDAMELDSDDHPPRKKQRVANSSKYASSSSAFVRANGKSFSKLEKEATESTDEHGVVLSSGSHSQTVPRLDLMDIRDVKVEVQSVQTVELSNGKLFYFVIL